MSESEINSNLKTDLTLQFNLLICGFKPLPDSRLVDILNNVQTYPNGVFIFFNTTITEDTFSLWAPKKVIIVKTIHGLTDYITKSDSDWIEYDKVKSIPSDLKIGLRSHELNIHQREMAEGNKQICIISGLPGIGKKAFVLELIYKKQIENTITINLKKEDNDIVLIDKIIRRLKIVIDDRFEGTTAEIKLNKIAKSFSSLEKTVVIIHNFEVCQDGVSGKITENALKFIETIVNINDDHKSNTNLKLYLTTRIRPEIEISPLLSQICFINILSLSIEQNYDLLSFYDNQRYATYDGKINYTLNTGEIAKNTFALTCGCPRFVSDLHLFSDGFNLDDFLSDPFQKLRFEAEHENYVKKNIVLNAEEKDVITFLSLFESPFDFDAFSEIHPNPGRIFKQLLNKNLIEVILSYPFGKKYIVPLLIRKVVEKNITVEVREYLQIRIGKYLLKKANPGANK